jgi:hypothetical protein
VALEHGNVKASEMRSRRRRGAWSRAGSRRGGEAGKNEVLWRLSRVAGPGAYALRRYEPGPQRGWAFSGGGIALAGTKGVAVKTTKADFNELFRVLLGASRALEETDSPDKAYEH